MDCRNCPWVFLPYGLCFAEYTFVPYKYFLANYVIIINPAFVFMGGVKVSLCLCSPIFFQSAMNGMSNRISHPNIAAPGEAFNTVWWVKRMAHAASAKKMLTSLALTDLAISSLAVCSMFVKTVWINSSIAFACGFLMLVGLYFTPYVLHGAQKWSLFSLPLA